MAPTLCGIIETLSSHSETSSHSSDSTVNAAKGDHRSQKLLMDMIRIVEATKDEQNESEEDIHINVVFE